MSKKKKKKNKKKPQTIRGIIWHWILDLSIVRQLLNIWIDFRLRTWYIFTALATWKLLELFNVVDVMNSRHTMILLQVILYLAVFVLAYTLWNFFADDIGLRSRYTQDSDFVDDALVETEEYKREKRRKETKHEKAHGDQPLSIEELKARFPDQYVEKKEKAAAEKRKSAYEKQNKARAEYGKKHAEKYKQAS